MRTLFHPSVEDMSVEGILYALSDPVRAQILMQLMAASCSKNCSTFLKVKGKSLPKSTLCQHFRVLREAGLIRSERRGVELHNTARCAEIKQRFGALVETVLKNYANQFESVRKRRAA